MAKRTLILVRHGQYHFEQEHDRHGRLTPLGQQQARRLAKRLRSYPVDVVHSSTAPRALETSDLVCAQLPPVPQRRSALLLEGIPTAFKGMPSDARGRIASHRARMDRAFARYFRPTRGKDRTDLLIFHGNILRYLLRRAIGDPPGKWSRLAVMHCGISIVQIDADARAKILAFNDVGHLPLRMQTFT